MNIFYLFFPYCALAIETEKYIYYSYTCTHRSIRILHFPLQSHSSQASIRGLQHRISFLQLGIFSIRVSRCGSSGWFFLSLVQLKRRRLFHIFAHFSHAVDSESARQPSYQLNCAFLLQDVFVVVPNELLATLFTSCGHIFTHYYESWLFVLAMHGECVVSAS